MSQTQLKNYMNIIFDISSLNCLSFIQKIDQTLICPINFDFDIILRY